MYPTVADTLELGTRVDEDRPVILCEYTHAMGNSNGNLDRYYDMFWAEDKPRIQGGFVWDMIDQGLRKVDKKTGREFFAYGGDFGEEIHDAQFCINGLYAPDRVPHPAVREIKYLHQPVAFTAHGEGAKIGGTGKEPLELTLKVKNRYSFSSLSHLELAYDVTCDTSEVPLASGKGMAMGDFVNIKASKVTASSLLESEVVPQEVWVNVTVTLKDGTSWAPKGHVIATEQFAVKLALDEVPTNVASRSSPSVLRKLTMGTLTGARTGLVSSGNPEAEIEVDDSGDTLSVNIDKVKGTVVIDKKTGGLLKLLTPSKKSIITGASGGVVYNVTRASTDNDRGGAQMLMEFVLPPPAIKVVGAVVGTGLFSHDYHWQQNGIGAGDPPAQICNEVKVDESVIKDNVGNFIEVQCEGGLRTSSGNDAFTTRTFYRVHRNGDIQIRCTVTPGKFRKDLKTLPRVGLQVALDPSLFNVGYLGKGDCENYPDRQSCAQRGIFRTTAASMLTKEYIVPGECGARQSCSWSSFTDRHGSGVLVRSSRPFSFSAGLHGTTELHTAMHTYDLADRKNGESPVYVNLSHEIAGIGGDCSWLPCIYDDYLVDPGKTYEFDFWLCPLAAGQADYLQAKRVIGI